MGKLKRFSAKPFSSKRACRVRGSAPPIVTEVSAYGANKNKGGEIQSKGTDELRRFFALSG
ncbi:MAG: hypothetical protein IJ740_17465, partial [Ruminococcus sp.]|nr:hypothetical protein [Ruminococcus sp.]